MTREYDVIILKPPDGDKPGEVKQFSSEGEVDEAVLSAKEYKSARNTAIYLARQTGDVVIEYTSDPNS